jgi:hypothetical protein
MEFWIMAIIFLNKILITNYFCWFVSIRYDNVLKQHQTK